jgi:hypothetical protein
MDNDRILNVYSYIYIYIYVCVCVCVCVCVRVCINTHTVLFPRKLVAFQFSVY